MKKKGRFTIIDLDPGSPDSVDGVSTPTNANGQLSPERQRFTRSTNLGEPPGEWAPAFSRTISGCSVSVIDDYENCE